MRASSGPEQGRVGVYLHVPFCARACPYCDFDFSVGRSPDVERYLVRMQREFEAQKEVLAAATVDTVYVGGGTPSMLRPEQLGAIFCWLREAAGRHLPREVTVEANPEHVTRDWLEGLRSEGVTRVSLGVQSLSPRGLVTLGRAHQANAALDAMKSVHQVGLEGSVDLIVGWPGQRIDEVQADVSAIAAAGVSHVSIYALTVEPGTPWEGLVARGVRPAVDEDAQAALLVACESALLAAGYEHYEIASYAKPGKQAAHNRKYWRWEDFLGYGPSAASAVSTVDGGLRRSVGVRGFEAWCDASPGAHGEVEVLGPEAAAREGLWLGLRLLEPLDLRALEVRFTRYEGWASERLARQMALGNVQRLSATHVQVAPDRWLWHDTIALDVLGSG